jgi:hypothetical protein
VVYIYNHILLEQINELFLIKSIDCLFIKYIVYISEWRFLRIDLPFVNHQINNKRAIIKNLFFF